MENKFKFEVISENNEYNDWRDWFLNDEDKYIEIYINYKLRFAVKEIFSINNYKLRVLKDRKDFMFTIIIENKNKHGCIISNNVIDIPNLKYKKCECFPFYVFSDGNFFTMKHYIHL